MQSNTPPLIAIVGCDGSGKSTVSERLLVFLQSCGPATRVHLGKQAGNVERALVRLPLMGRFLKKKINHNRISVSRSHYSPLTALVLMAFVLRRLLRFRRMLKLRRRGNIILADRFPQMEIQGGYDGLLLPADATAGRLVNRLAGLEKSAFRWMTGTRPDLVIKLNVSLDVACARKPDHRRTSLAKKIAITPTLTFNGCQVANVDTDRPLDQVLSDVLNIVADFMQRSGYQTSVSGQPINHEHTAGG